jgi:N-formylglutamate amidohydrolase
MEFASFDVSAPGVVIATAVHNGHDLRPEIAEVSALDEESRLREEDPHTGALARQFANNVVVHRSRFEVDLNRERDQAVYLDQDDAWGLEVWGRPLQPSEIAESLRLYDRFYADLARAIDRMVTDIGGFVLYDIHSYNHVRSGPGGEPDPAEESPVVNLGTGSLPDRWKRVAEAFIETARGEPFDGRPLDVRENVRFEGRQVAAWVHENYGEVGCALAIEVKKVFMDEWSGEVDRDRLEQLASALVRTVDPVSRAWESS